MHRLTNMTSLRLAATGFAALATVLVPASAHGQVRLVPADSRALPAPAVPIDYTDYASLALAAPVVADAAIRDAVRISGAEAVGLQPGLARYYVTADVTALIRGPAGLPARLSWLVDLPLDPRGKAVAPRKKSRVLVFARPLPARPAMLQLIALDAQRAWTPDSDQTVRAVLTEAMGSTPPPVVTGVGKVFFVPGALPGEGETQIFLLTANNRPVSLSVVTDAAGQKRWTVALNEVVDAASPPPPRDTLLWYRLACSLPATLPPGSVVADDAGNMARARDDYGHVIRELGRCGFPPRAGAPR